MSDPFEGDRGRVAQDIMVAVARMLEELKIPDAERTKLFELLGSTFNGMAQLGRLAQKLKGAPLDETEQTQFVLCAHEGNVSLQFSGRVRTLTISPDAALMLGANMARVAVMAGADASLLDDLEHEGQPTVPGGQA